MVRIGSKAERSIEDLMLTWYVCHPELERKIKATEKKLVQESELPKDEAT